MGVRTFASTVVVAAAISGCAQIGQGGPDAGSAADLDAASRPAPEPDAAHSPILIDTLTVPSDGTVVMSSPTAAGDTYLLRVTGTYTWGVCDAVNCPGGGSCNYDRYGDAFYRTDDCWTSTTTNFAAVSLWLDGVQVDWGPYSAQHSYTLEQPGTGAPFQLDVNDCPDCYGDNIGQLEVRVYQVDAP